MMEATTIPRNPLVVMSLPGFQPPQTHGMTNGASTVLIMKLRDPVITKTHLTTQPTIWAHWVCGVAGIVVGKFSSVILTAPRVAPRNCLNATIMQLSLLSKSYPQVQQVQTNWENLYATAAKISWVCLLQSVCQARHQKSETHEMIQKREIHRNSSK